MQMQLLYYVGVIAICLYFFNGLMTANPNSLVVFGQLLNSYKSTNLDDNISSGLNNNSLRYLTNLLNFSTPNSQNSNEVSKEFTETKIGLVKPVFTDAAYDNKFYIFYKKKLNELKHLSN